MTTIRCNRCKVLLPSEKFKKKRCGNYYKSCEDCRVKQKENREKSRRGGRQEGGMRNAQAKRQGKCTLIKCTLYM